MNVLLLSPDASFAKELLSNNETGDLEVEYAKNLSTAIEMLGVKMFELVILCSNELTHREQEFLDIIGYKYPDLSIIIKVGDKNAESQMFMKRGVYLSTIESLNVQ